MKRGYGGVDFLSIRSRTLSDNVQSLRLTHPHLLFRSKPLQSEPVGEGE